MKRLFHTFFILLSIFSFSVNAETLKANSPGDIAKDAHLANINALLIFTSQNGLNTGLFHFTNVGVDMEIYSLPFEYQFKSDSNINYFLVGNVGYSRVFVSKDIVLPPNSRLTYDNHLRTYTAGLGIGMRYMFSDELRFLGGLEFIYSRSGASVKKPDNDIGDAIEDFFNKNYNDNLSYKFFVEAEYKPKFESLNPYFKIGYNLYDTKSNFTFDELSDIQSESSVVSASLGLESNELYRFDSSYLTLEGYLNVNYLSGQVEKSVQFDTYTKVGAVAYLYLEDKDLWVERLFLEASSVNADGLDGYNIGIGFTIDY